MFAQDTDKLFVSFNSVKCAAPGQTLLSPLGDNTLPIGHWTKASMVIKNWISLKNGKPAFKKLTPSQNEGIIDIDAVQHMWRTLKRQVLTILRP